MDEQNNPPRLRLRTICAADILPIDFSRLAAVAGNVIRSNVQNQYDLPLDRCRNHQEILGWAFHLSSKTWMTSALLQHFIRLACTANRIEVLLSRQYTFD